MHMYELRTARGGSRGHAGEERIHARPRRRAVRVAERAKAAAATAAARGRGRRIGMRRDVAPRLKLLN